MIIGYARVSTIGQAKDGNSLEAQEKALKEAGADIIYKDSFSGKSMDRPQFDEMNQILTERSQRRSEGLLDENDTLVVTKLDRIARTAVGGSAYIDKLLDKGISVHVLNIGVLNNSASGKLIRHVLMAFAEFERDLILQRTREGKEIARLKEGYHEGRPKKFTCDELKYAMDLLDAGDTYQAVSLSTGISISTLSREKRRRKATKSSKMLEKIKSSE